MSYEGKMFIELGMPSRKAVADALLKSLFKHSGTLKEFAVGEAIVEEIADDFHLNTQQRSAYLETVYRQENRVKRSRLWHRLLFRAADALAKERLVSRPTQTALLTHAREWMLTEDGYDRALRLLNIPISQKDTLRIKSYEVQKIVKKLGEQPRPHNYNPFETGKKVARVTKDIKLRNRGFRQAIIEAYDYKCAVCGMKISSPDGARWEVEAAHIVPHNLNGRDDFLNGLALCRLHHWAFDVGWFTLEDNYCVLPSKRIEARATDVGKIGSYDFFGNLASRVGTISLPKNAEIHPHRSSVRWHRDHVYAK